MKNIIIALFFLTSLTGYTQVTEEWTARYNGIADSTDSPSSMVIDALGNVYVTGRSIGLTNSDYLTIKYNSSGMEQWVARYDSPPDGNDVPSAIALDSSGNIYVSGQSGTSSSNSDYVTIKYNSSGIEQWAARYNGDSLDRASAITLDGTGNVYVTGVSGTASNGDFLTIKYNSSGVEQWVVSYNGPDNKADLGTSIIIDLAGNVFVGGHSMGTTLGSSYYVLIKYNSAGVEQWVTRYGSSENANVATSIGLDNIGNVYVTGLSSGDSTNYDFATIKYNSSGLEQWVARYNGPANSIDTPSELVIDDLGNTYVTGEISIGGFNTDCATIKYNSSGVEQWVATYNAANSADRAYSLVLDGSGNVYICGSSYGGPGTFFDYVTIKYNSSGVEQWVKRYNGPVNLNDEAGWIAIDNSENIYVTGYTTTSGNNRDFFTIKYSQGSTGIENISNENINNFNLSQNYPNPFNPTTKISWQSSVGNWQTLKIYDVLGNEIATLVNEYKPAGTYEAEWDAEGLTSGIYFYQLKSGNFSESRKMILLR